MRPRILGGVQYVFDLLSPPSPPMPWRCFPGFCTHLDNRYRSLLVYRDLRFRSSLQHRLLPRQ